MKRAAVGIRMHSGWGVLVAVVGEPGAGKSRLLFEFRNSLARDQVGIVEGRCQSYGAETPYLPFLDALRRALNLRDEDSPDQLLDKVVTQVNTIDASLERFVPHYLHLLSIPSTQHVLPADLQGGERRRAFEEALVALFTLSAKRQPWIVVLEDITYFVWRGRWVQPGEWTTTLFGSFRVGGRVVPTWWVPLTLAVLALYLLPL